MMGRLFFALRTSQFFPQISNSLQMSDMRPNLNLNLDGIEMDSYSL